MQLNLCIRIAMKFSRLIIRDNGGKETCGDLIIIRHRYAFNIFQYPALRDTPSSYHHHVPFPSSPRLSAHNCWDTMPRCCCCWGEWARFGEILRAWYFLNPTAPNSPSIVSESLLFRGTSHFIPFEDQSTQTKLILSFTAFPLLREHKFSLWLTSE